MISRTAAHLPGAALIILLLFSCSDAAFRLKSHGFGQEITRAGKITNGSTVFSFPVYARGGTNRDLFNYLYFKGDTLCFSFRFSHNVEGRAVAAAFIDPVTGQRFPAERLEKSGNTVWGFSLAGSLMEKFQGGRLDGAIPANAFCCANIPFAVEVTVAGREGDILTARKESSFRIEYR
jgi:hypothetical protein